MSFKLKKVVVFLKIFNSIPVNFFYIYWPVYKALAVPCAQVGKDLFASDLIHIRYIGF